MRSFVPTVLAVAPFIAAIHSQTTSDKRGLCYVPSEKHPQDDDYWDSSTSDLTWYYNYQESPSSAYENSSLYFVPMLWGIPSDPADDMTFYNTVAALIEGGTNITYVLGFNEPDGCSDGGSCIAAADAATVWKKQFEPLKAKYGVQLGAPAVTGSNSGFTWLNNWFSECSSISNSTCEVDFIPMHWYGDFEGLASHIGQVNATYLNVSSSLWLTEFACSECTLEDSQQFYNESTEYLDSLDYVTHYSYFGAFRSDVSNVGPNAAFLTQKGKLTDIGSWYLGGVETNNIPKGSASTVAKFAGWSAVVAASIFWSIY